MSRSVVALLEADPDLGSHLAPTDLPLAERALVAPSIMLAPGLWRRAERRGDDLAATTLLILDGLLLSDTVLWGCPSAELIGLGDVLPSPGARSDADTLLPVEVELTVLEPTRVALLDERVELSCARWPPVAVALMERMEQRARRLAKQAAICHLPSVPLRLLALFWHLGDRWGKVTPTSVVLPLHIVHRTLGKMVGAERSTVSLALRQLSEAGLVTRRPDGSWLLRGDPSKGLELMNERGIGRPAALVPR